MTRKGATKFDNLCHQIFSANGNGTDYLGRESGIRCGHCGHELGTYYCESRLYLVECRHCKIKALVEARSPSEAAYRTFGHALYKAEEMDEGLAVFFDHIPIDEPPIYVGTTIDCDFPENAAYGMYVPCLGTDGKELT